MNVGAIKAVVLLRSHTGSAFHNKLIQNIELLEKDTPLEIYAIVLMSHKLEVVTPLYTSKKSCFSVLPELSATRNNIIAEVL